MKPSLFAGASVVLTVALTATAASAGSTIDAKPASEKSIRLNPGSAPIELKVTPIKDRFEVDELINLDVKLSAEAYVYIYTRDETGMTSVLYPGPKDEPSANRLSKGAHRLKTLIAGDKAAQETIVAFATAKPMDFADLDLSATRTVEFENFIAVQGVGVLTSPHTGFSSIQPVTLAIGDVGSPQSGSDAGVPLVTTDKASYKTDEAVKLTVGSSQPGYVHVYLVSGEGRVDALTTEQFETSGIRTLTATAQDPTGEQTIVAIYCQNATMDEEKVRVALSENDSAPAIEKALQLNPSDDAKPLAVTIRVIEIEGEN